MCNGVLLVILGRPLGGPVNYPVSRTYAVWRISTLHACPVGTHCRSVKDSRTARALAATLGGTGQQQPRQPKGGMAATAQDRDKAITRELAEAAAAVASANTAHGGVLASALLHLSGGGGSVRRSGAVAAAAGAGGSDRV